MEISIKKRTKTFLVETENYLAQIDQQIEDLLMNDPFMESQHYLISRGNLTEKLVDAEISLHHGQAKRLFLQRADGPRLSIVVRNDARVDDVYRAVVVAVNQHLAEVHQKASLRAEIENKEQEKKRNRKDISEIFANTPPPERINWRQFWRSYSLTTASADSAAVLEEGSHRLKAFGEAVKNGSVLRFIRRRRRK